MCFVHKHNSLSYQYNNIFTVQETCFAHADVTYQLSWVTSYDQVLCSTRPKTVLVQRVTQFLVVPAFCQNVHRKDTYCNGDIGMQITDSEGKKLSIFASHTYTTIHQDP